MRIWHYELLPYLPDLQFKGQLRELVAIMHDWRDKGKTNHILINKVMLFPKADLNSYYFLYAEEYYRRYKKYPMKYSSEFNSFADNSITPFEKLFNGWHNKYYLRICMANLYEKHFALGKSRITDEEWRRLLEGYEAITGEEYIL